MTSSNVIIVAGELPDEATEAVEPTDLRIFGSLEVSLGKDVIVRNPDPPVGGLDFLLEQTPLGVLDPDEELGDIDVVVLNSRREPTLFLLST